MVVSNRTGLDLLNKEVPSADMENGPAGLMVSQESLFGMYRDV